MLSKEERIQNLKRASEESHKLASTALKEALYKLLIKKNIQDITVTELIKVAGVSRATYYKHYYYLTDLLMEDIDEIMKAVWSSRSLCLRENWLLIFTKVYEQKDKLALIYKAGLSMEFLKKLNLFFKGDPDEEKYIVAIGVFFNTVYDWGVHGFKKSPEVIVDELMEATEYLFFRRRERD